MHFMSDFQNKSVDIKESALCSPVDIYEVKRSQRHLLAFIENNRLVSPIALSDHKFRASVIYGTDVLTQNEIKDRVTWSYVKI